ncbi:MAG: ATPase [Candidatus Eremiobacteraeota bacterium]|nr:ATPase [Candidatus Eremiobacteraeota bacterium]
MSVYTVIDKLESSIKEGVWLPFGARIVSQDQLLDLLEKLRSTLPDEVGRAKAVTKEKDRLIEDAKAQAAAMITQASTTKTQLLDDSEISRQASERASQIVAQAERQAREIRRGAEEYADGVLSSLDTSLGNALAAVHKGREQLATSLSGNGSLEQRAHS